MKKWLSLAVFNFRWGRMTKHQRAIFIAGTGLQLVVCVLLVVMVNIPVVDENGLNDYVGKFAITLFAFFVYLVATVCNLYTIEVEGRINQKYLKEINEIKVSLGRKPLEEI